MILRFLSSLKESGRAELAMPGSEILTTIRACGRDPGELAALDRMLRDWHELALQDLPGPPLDYHGDAAIWGALRLFRAACFLSFREIEPEEIAFGLPGLPMPDLLNPAAHFSVDLCMRHWPALFRMARALAGEDPLIEAMMKTIAQLPLAAVGIPIPMPEESPVFDHPGLCQILAERACLQRDHRLLSHPRVRALTISKLGIYRNELLPNLLPSPELIS